MPRYNPDTGQYELTDEERVTGEFNYPVEHRIAGPDEVPVYDGGVYQGRRWIMDTIPVARPGGVPSFEFTTGVSEDARDAIMRAIAPRRAMSEIMYASTTPVDDNETWEDTQETTNRRFSATLMVDGKNIPEALCENIMGMVMHHLENYNDTPRD